MKTSLLHKKKERKKFGVFKYIVVTKNFSYSFAKKLSLLQTNADLT